MIDIVERIEKSNRILIGEKMGENGWPELDSGLAFPTGCSLNHCADWLVGARWLA